MPTSPFEEALRLFDSNDPGSLTHLKKIWNDLLSVNGQATHNTDNSFDTKKNSHQQDLQKTVSLIPNEPNQIKNMTNASSLKTTKCNNSTTLPAKSTEPRDNNENELEATDNDKILTNTDDQFQRSAGKNDLDDPTFSLFLDNEAPSSFKDTEASSNSSQNSPYQLHKHSTILSHIDAKNTKSSKQRLNSSYLSIDNYNYPSIQKQRTLYKNVATSPSRQSHSSNSGRQTTIRPHNSAVLLDQKTPLSPKSPNSPDNQVVEGSNLTFGDTETSNDDDDDVLTEHIQDLSGDPDWPGQTNHVLRTKSDLVQLSDESEEEGNGIKRLQRRRQRRTVKPQFHPQTAGRLSFTSPQQSNILLNQASSPPQVEEEFLSKTTAQTSVQVPAPLLVPSRRATYRTQSSGRSRGRLSTLLRTYRNRRPSGQRGRGGTHQARRRRRGASERRERGDAKNRKDAKYNSDSEGSSTSQHCSEGGEDDEDGDEKHVENDACDECYGAIEHDSLTDQHFSLNNEKNQTSSIRVKENDSFCNLYVQAFHPLKGRKDRSGVAKTKRKTPPENDLSARKKRANTIAQNSTHQAQDSSAFHSDNHDNLQESSTMAAQSHPKKGGVNINTKRPKLTNTSRRTGEKLSGETPHTKHRADNDSQHSGLLSKGLEEGRRSHRSTTQKTRQPGFYSDFSDLLSDEG